MAAAQSDTSQETEEYFRQLFHVQTEDWHGMLPTRKDEFLSHASSCLALSKRVLSAWASYASNRHPKEKRKSAHAAAAGRYVRQILELECTTSISEGDTTAAISSHIPTAARDADDPAYVAAQNIWSAFMFLRDDIDIAEVKPEVSLREQMKQAYVIPELPIHVHERVMSDLLPSPGSFRTGHAMASGSTRRYRAPQEIESSLVFAADSFMARIDKILAADQSECELLVEIASTAANFFQDFLMTHPFPDGNGRTARTLMCALLGQSLTGVPFTLLPFDGQRASLLSALELSRKPFVSSAGVAALTHMVLLGLCDALEAWVACVEEQPVRRRILVQPSMTPEQLLSHIKKRPTAFGLPNAGFDAELEVVAAELVKAASTMAAEASSVNCSVSVADTELRFEVFNRPFGLPD